MSENVEIVRRQLDAFNRGDLATLLDLADPAVEWWDSANDPDANVHRGHEAVRRHLADFADSLADLQIQPQDFIDAGDAVVVPVRFAGRGRASGASFEQHEALVFRLRSGKIVEVREYPEQREALKAVGLEG